MGIKQRLTGVLLFTLVFLTGCSLFVISVIWIRQFLLLAGINIISIVVVTTAFLINFAAGSTIFGRLSDKLSNQTNLVFVLMVLVSLYSFLFSSAFSLSELIARGFSLKINNDLFGASVFRFVLTLVFFIPFTFTGGIYPVLSRLITRHVSQAGQKTGVVIALLSFGALAGFRIMWLPFIYSQGYSKILVYAAIALIIIAVLFKFISHEAIGSLSPMRSPLAVKAKRSGLLLKTQKVLEAEPKLIITLLWVFTLEGFWSMILVLIWIRSLLSIPDVDTGMAVSWVLFTGLLAFGTGSLIFKGLTAHSEKKFHLPGLTYMLTGFAVAGSFVLFNISLTKVPLVAEVLDMALPPHKPASLLLPAILLFIPALLIGATFPMASRLYPRRVQKTGQRVGHLNFIFISGAIAGLLMANFILIPLFGIYNLIFAVTVISLFTGLLLFLRDSRYRRSFRIMLLLVAIGLSIALQRFLTKSEYTLQQSLMFSSDTIRPAKEGPTAMAYIMEDSTGATELYINGRKMVSSDANSISSERMLAFISSVMGSSGGQACVAGFGTGVVASALEGLGYETIRVTETHPELIQLSASVFSAINNDVLTREVLEITQEDARSILGRSKNNFDLIIMPYSELFTRPDLYTTGFYKLTHEKLDSSGVFCCFLSSGTLGKNRIMDILKTCGEVYPNVSLWHTGENSFAMLAAKDRLWDYCRIQRTYNFFAHRAGFENQPFEAFLANLLLGDREIRSVTEEAHVYDENKPLLKVTTNTDQETVSITEIFSENEINYSSVFRFSGNCVTSEPYTFNIINSYRKILLARMQLLQ